MNLLQMLLGGFQQESTVQNISAQSGASGNQIMKLIAMALPLLIKYMTKNAGSQEGAMSLLGALGQHKETNNIAKQVKDADVDDGKKIIGHILGDDKKEVLGNLAEETGMDVSQVNDALGSMAPGLLSGVSAAADTAGTQKKKGVDLSDGIDLGDVMGLLGGMTGGSGGGGGLGDLLGGLGGLFGGEKKPEKKGETNGNDLLGMLAKMM